VIHRLKEMFIRSAVRTRFRLTSRNQASDQIRKLLAGYLLLIESIDLEAGRLPVRVAPMLGVDEEMRDWSMFMILEHNVIVNRSISAIVTSLANDEEPAGIGVADPKRDVMPSADPGKTQIQAFQSSVETHLEIVSRLTRLRSTPTYRHPVFGQLNAHGWHCMFGLHLDIHRNQAKAVCNTINHGPVGNNG
jgi:hypothetical protein